MEPLTEDDYAMVKAEREKIKAYYTEKYKPSRIKQTLTDHACSNCGCVIPKHSKNAWFVKGHIGATVNHNPVFCEGKYLCGDCYKES